MTEPALPRDFADFLRELTTAGAEYVIIGGYAVAAWGHQRATKDLDILVRPTLENARKVLAALAALSVHVGGRRSRTASIANKRSLQAW